LTQIKDMILKEIDKVGIRDGISETIVTTFSSNIANAAPMGIIRADKNIKIRIFKGSDTYNNILVNPFLTANIIYDPLLYVVSTFSNLNPSEFRKKDYNNIAYYPLVSSVSFVLFECRNIQEKISSLTADLIPLHYEINSNMIKAPNRGFFSVIESCIHGTRYQLTGSDKFLALIKKHENIVNKCGGTREKESFELIYKYLERTS